MKKLIFGHKNPDTDSVVSAIALSYLKNTLGEETEPRVLGNLNRETEFALKYFKVKKPEYLNDVKLQVRDVNYSKNLFMKETESIYSAYKYMINHNITGIPIVKGDNDFLSLITIKDLAMNIVSNNYDKLDTSYDNLLKDLGGEELLHFDDEIRGKILIASYKSSRILGNVNLDNTNILILGDRHSIIDYAIKSKVKLIILTGGSEIHNKHIKLAKKNKVNIIRSPYDTYHLSRIVPLTNYIRTLISNSNPIKFYTTDYISNVKEINSKLRHTNYPVINKAGKCTGLLRITDLNDINPKRVVLVDHNEPMQSADGLDEAIVEEVIDHHNLSTLTTAKPINFRGMAVGSTSTIIYTLFIEKKLAIPENIAGMLLSGILSDTLILKSPTTTDKDREAVTSLSKLAKVNYEEYGLELLKAGTSLKGMKVEDVIFNDYKLFTVSNKTFAIGQFFTMNFEDIRKDITSYIEALNKLAEANNYILACLYITDIIKNGSYVIFNEKGKNLMSSIYNKEIEEGTFIDKCLSRKQDIVPLIIDAIDND
ncbi:MAG: putative manganese-dependent inorganic diphosphatase [Bacilli bacterium]|nr:putative manganese-dependent inorganic diphosphatase [Bacilli bacterium]